MTSLIETSSISESGGDYISENATSTHGLDMEKMFGWLSHPNDFQDTKKGSHKLRNS